MKIDSTINGTYLAPEIDRRAVKLALRIQQLMNNSYGHIINMQIIDSGDGAVWLFVNGGKKEVIE